MLARHGVKLFPDHGHRCHGRDFACATRNAWWMDAIESANASPDNEGRWFRSGSSGRDVYQTRGEEYTRPRTYWVDAGVVRAIMAGGPGVAFA